MAETVAMREKMEKTQLAFRKAQGMDDYLYNMGGISSKTPIALPLKFKISSSEKFDGTGDPKQHVRRYLSIAEMKGLDEKQTLHAFPLSLTEGASRWYYSLDPSKTKIFGELCDYGTRIEDAINNGQLEKGESKPLIKKAYGGGATSFKAPNLGNVNAIIPQQTLAYPSFTEKAHRECGGCMGDTSQRKD
ncbi:hypothetical protein SO802_017711 [Lithocarpus litseifolius]|uniref:Uncharacterized protein n=1 Tax=Lithocarpus litseifolius TaxID=425828 RepID=A0AAW2CJ80_9ROSI